MTVVFVNRYFHPDQSATSRLLTDLSTALAASGRAVAVVTSRQRIDDPRSALPWRDDVAGVEVHRVRTSAFGRGGLAGRAADYASFHLAASRRVASLCGPGDVVVAETDPPLLSITMARVAARTGSRHVNWLHDLFPEIATELGVPGLTGGLGRWLTRRRDDSLRAAHANVALGDSMAARLYAARVPRERVRVVHNWADGNAIRPLPAGDNALRREWGLDGRFVVGYAGNLGRAHEFATVLDAASRLRGEPDGVFTFVGDGYRRREIEARAAALGGDRIRLHALAPHERLGESLGVPDVHLVTLRPALEGLVVPSKLYAAAAAGRPILFVGATDGEIAALLTSARCGLVFAPGDDDALATAIRELRDDSARRAAMGAAARAMFEGRFDRPRALAAWSALLDEMESPESV